MNVGGDVCECISVSVCLSHSGNKRVYLPVCKLQGSDHLRCVGVCLCACVLFVVGACV